MSINTGMVVVWCSTILTATLTAASQETDPIPIKLNDCVRTKIAVIGSRLGWPNPSMNDEGGGTGISYTNGVIGISYDRVENVLKFALVGDVVLLCLVEVPENCPPGDNRGRVYKATDQRTGKSWILSDSQHACGGA